MVKQYVGSFCNIFNFIKVSSPELADILEQLCLIGMLTPRKGGEVTFLMPDAALLKKIVSTSMSNPVEATGLLRSLVIYNLLPRSNLTQVSAGEMFSVAGRKMIKVEKVDKDSITLESKGGKCVIKPNKKFVSREDRTNMDVWDISGSFPDAKENSGMGMSRNDSSDEESEDEKEGEGEGKKKETKKKGGISISGGARHKYGYGRRMYGGYAYGNDKRELFEKVMRVHFQLEKDDVLSKKNDPSLETIVSLIRWMNESGFPNNRKMEIFSKMTNDTLGSLAIILQPYKSNNKTNIYLKDEEFTLWKNKYGLEEFDAIHSFSYQRDVVKTYNEARQQAANYYKSDVMNIWKGILDADTGKYDTASTLKAYYVEIYNKLKPNGDKIPTYTDADAYALAMCMEAELRVCSIIISCDCPQPRDLSEKESRYKQLFTTDCSFDKSLFCDDLKDGKPKVTIETLPFLSTLKYVTNSNIFFYLYETPAPGRETAKKYNELNAKGYFNADLEFTLPNDEVYNQRVDSMLQMMKDYKLIQ